MDSLLPLARHPSPPTAPAIGCPIPGVLAELLGGRGEQVSSHTELWGGESLEVGASLPRPSKWAFLTRGPRSQCPDLVGPSPPRLQPSAVLGRH